ncbi:MAG TPA: bifunctional DNA-binding transcriptional regulator/O6-methylguanine-DNA methyltransferase Ada [Myxococcales bacterium]|nr:bifunctional DNA-binding transcriptional regulator/O6-methylguanine-DNA methyltransferase Ada [Myxococcales bacterium]
MTIAVQMARVQMPDPETAWAAVLKRDALSDGTFVYAVSSTGVYCRPSCGSRRPRRDRVSFFAGAAEAEAAGYRACLRCGKENSAKERVERARRYLDAHVDERVTLQELGKVAGLSPFHLQRTFQRVFGLTPKAYASAGRTERFKRSLKIRDDVTTAIYEAGFGSSSRAYESADQRLGMTPSAYRRGGDGMHIRYAIVDSPLGRLLVAATDRGVCSVALGDDDEFLLRELRREYPRAQTELGGDELREAVSAVVRHLEGRSSSLQLPIDVTATAFQWRVWKALQRIPYGSTRSYEAIAAEIGQPRAVRAVARACATNRVALLIPCHRAVRKTGALGGYRWGISRKAQLLEREVRGKKS